MALAFLIWFANDLAQGRRRPLSEYQARFPGFELVIQEQYRTVTRERESN